MNKHSELPTYETSQEDTIAQFGADVPGLPPHIQQFAFVGKRLGGGHRVFLDKDTAEKYYLFKGKENEMVLDLQKSGRVIPLMKYLTGFFSGNKKGQFLKGKIPTTRPFQESDEDYVKYGSQKRTDHFAFNKYTLELPNITVLIYRHRSIPITDFAIKGVRYRWIYKRNRGFAYDAYTYTLFKLGDSQPSLLDGMIDDKISKENPYHQGFFKLLAKSVYGYGNPSKYAGVEQLAHFECVRDEGIRRKITEILLVAMDPVETVLDLDETALMYISMASIFKTIEYERQTAEKSV